MEMIYEINHEKFQTCLENNEIDEEKNVFLG